MKAKMRFAKRLCALALAICLCLAVSVTALADSNLDTSATAVENSDGDYDVEFSATIGTSLASLLVRYIISSNSSQTITCNLTSDIIAQLSSDDISYDLEGSLGLNCENSISVNGDTATVTFVLTSPFDESSSAEAEALIEDVSNGNYSTTVAASASMTAEEFEAAGGSGTIAYSIEIAASLLGLPYSYSSSGTVGVTEYDSDKETTGSTSSSSSTSGTTTDTSTDDTALAFSDVSADDYFYSAVYWAVEQGITNGTDDNSFSPNSGCTRAQAVTFLWRAYGSPAPASGENPFTDISDGDYFCQAALWANETGITTGATETTFDPDAACSRAQIDTFLYRDYAENRAQKRESPIGT
ncbi:MAG: S-layer homology domain-containing protein, partial [Oscillospiraceae bacterium]|nr:S-layer homology domain-containing protein [Oscillospiraceae bacterium]